jgi:hypothetical protein
MGKRFLRTIVRDFQTLTASADITPVDLPVNPLSVLYLTLAATKNVAAQVTNLGRLMVPILQQVTNLEVNRAGQSVIQGRLDDLAVLNALITRQPPAVADFAQADNEVLSVTIPLSFSRRPYWHEEALPATKRGDLEFRMSAGALPTGFDAVSWALEAIQLIEDEPVRHLKYTTRSRALSATGRQQIDLPINNEILGVLLFDPSDETDATMEYAFGKVKLLKDSVEQYYPESNWESLREAVTRRLSNYTLAWGHQHGQAAADTDTGEEQVKIADRPPLQYGYLDFDPLDDGSYSLETRGAATLQLDFSSDVASGTIRMVPVELMAATGAAAAAA